MSIVGNISVMQLRDVSVEEIKADCLKKMQQSNI